ncbi:YjgN family protein [Atlantibacter subterraneus]|uniref:YjgN family protein n=1 Tax=Atlantibacter subterraneus TaxID=255519 RepID=UPI00289D1C9C|nr:DUF898 family protein [Atlantibacter subterranea]
MDLEKNADRRHTFVFHGKGIEYFGIWLVNAFLTIITLGIYLPWAVVKTRKYICSKTELSGAFFSYHAKGSAIFVSWLLFFILYVIFVVVLVNQKVVAASIMLLLFVLFIPWGIVLSLRYQALMTRLNGIRFSFHCSLLRAWWVMMGCPLLLMIACTLILFGFMKVMPSPDSLNGLIVNTIILVLMAFILLGIINGISMAMWMRMFAGSSSFGNLRFSAFINTKQCIKISMLSYLMLLPFIGVLIKINAPLFSEVSLSIMSGLSQSEIEANIFANHIGVIVTSYLIYFLAILVCVGYLLTACRNYFWSALTLGNNIRFSSTLNFSHMVWLLLSNFALVAVTCGLAYPWAKIRLLRYMASHSEVIGSLEDIQDSDEVMKLGFMTVLSRGLIVTIPFT